MKKYSPHISNRNWLFVLIVFLQSYTPQAQTQPLGAFDHHEDIGNPKIKGSAVFNQEDQTYTLTAAGKNMWANTDQFHFAWNKI